MLLLTSDQFFFSWKLYRPQSQISVKDFISVIRKYKWKRFVVYFWRSLMLMMSNSGLKIRKFSGKIYRYMKLYIYLARIMQTLPNNKVDRDPGNGQVCHQFPTDSTNDINARTYIQDFIAKKRVIVWECMYYLL